MKKDRLVKNSLKALKALTTRKLTLENDCIPFKYQNVPFKKIFNAIRVGMSIYVKPGIPWGWPVTLQVEPANICNLRCAFCPVTDGMDRPEGLMDFDLLKNIIDKVGDYLLLIILWDWGEPFLNPAIYDMIAYAKERGIKTVSSTNGHLFAKRENAEKLIRSGIDSIIVAIDGITPKTYKQFRQSGSLETALMGIRNLIACKSDLNTRIPLINLRFIVTKNNEHEIADLKNLAKDLGVDVLTIKTLNPYDIYSENRAEKLADYQEIIPVEARYKRFEYEDQEGTRRRVKRKPPCTRPWDCLTVRWNGVIPMCTYDYKELYALGNIKTDDIRKIWYKNPLRGLRRQFRSNWEQIQICENCTYAYQGGSCDGETIVEVLYSHPFADLFSNPDYPEKINPLYDTE